MDCSCAGGGYSDSGIAGSDVKGSGSGRKRNSSIVSLLQVVLFRIVLALFPRQKCSIS